jgi:hypothetical protein
VGQASPTGAQQDRLRADVSVEDTLTVGDGQGADQASGQEASLLDLQMTFGDSCRQATGVYFRIDQKQVGTV